MMSYSSGSRRLSSIRVLLPSERSVQTFPREHHHLDLVRQTTSPSLGFAVNEGFPQRLTKLLLNVNIERSVGPVHVVMPSEKTVSDLIKAVIEVYVKEKRRPWLVETDPKFYQLHYSPFNLESLKPEEKLINLESRNFYLYLNPSSSVTSRHSEEAKMASHSLFLLTKFMEFMM